MDLGAVEEGFLFLGGAFAEVGVVGGFDDGQGAADDFLAAGWVEVGQAFGDDGDVARADLEKAIATE